MSDDTDKTSPAPAAFDFSAYPPNTLFHERRLGRDRRTQRDASTVPGDATAESMPTSAPRERRVKKERRRRIDPTTFEKQYTDDEMEFMNAMQRYKERTGKPFPSYGEVIKVAVSLGYRKGIDCPDDDSDSASFDR